MTHSQRMKLLWANPDYRAKMLEGSRKGGDRTAKMSEFDKAVMRERLRRRAQRKVQDKEAMGR